MKAADHLAFGLHSLRTQPTRTLLIVLAVAIGVAGVVVLVWLGAAARAFVTSQFHALGTNLVIVLPGRSETTGALPPMFGETARDLTLDDANAIRRSGAVHRLAPVVVGSAFASHGDRMRETTVIGTTAAFADLRRLTVARGRFLPDDRSGKAVCVLGAVLARELFGGRNPVGEVARVGDRRFRVAGVLASGGVSLGMDLDEMVLLPVAEAQALFDSPGLFRVIVEATGKDTMARAVADVRRIVTARHEGEEDVTVITQDALASTFDGILRALTLVVAGIAAISLAVAGILVMNVMIVAVAQRRAEIGLLKALGARSATIRALFLGEALLLSLAGGVLGIALGELASRIVPRFAPGLEPGVPAWAIAAALLVAGGCGLLFGTLPASRAARLDPVAALARR
jgi:putative ABC transport system permease protein